MAFDLNTPAEEGEKVPDLNRSPVELEDGYDSLEGVVATKVWGAHHFGLHLVQNDEQEQIYQGDHAGHPFHLHDLQGEQENMHAGDIAGHPFDLNDPLEDQENLHAGDIAGHAFDLNDPLEDQENLHAAYDNMGSQEQQDTLDDVIHDFGVYTDDIDIIFDEDELSDSDDEDYQQPLQQEATNVVRILTDRQRQDIYEDLLKLSTNGILQRNSTSLVAPNYNVHRRTVQRIWQRAKDCLAQGIPVDVKSLRPKNCGWKKIQVDLTSIVDIPLNRRGSIRSLAYALGKSKSTVHRLFKEGLLRRHSNALRPYLKEENKQARLRWVLSKLDPSTLPNNPKLEHMKNVIHSDEKWFNGTQKNMTVYLHLDEEDPHRIFLTLQGCMMEVMKDGGGNRYKIPHMNKERLESLGILPEALSCDSQLVQTAFELLH